MDWLFKPGQSSAKGINKDKPVILEVPDDGGRVPTHNQSLVGDKPPCGKGPLPPVFHFSFVLGMVLFVHAVD